MEKDATAAPSDGALFDQMLASEQPLSPSDHWRTLSDTSYHALDPIDHLLNFDIKHFDFEELNTSLSPPPPPTASLVSVDSEITEEPNSQTSTPAPVGPSAGLDRGKSVVSGDLCMPGGGADGDANGGGEKKVKRRRKHVSVDPSLTALMEAGPAISVGRRPMEPEELAELARVDPKKAKRILANRESAAKSKERKRLYLMELQKKVELLDIQVATLFNNISMLERNITDRIVCVKELRIKLDAMLQDDQIKDALSGVLNGDVEGLDDENKNLQVLLSYRSPGDLFSPFPSMLTMHQYHHPPSQQHLNPLQTQLPMPNPLPPSGQSFTGHYGPNCSNFNQRK